MQCCELDWRKLEESAHSLKCVLSRIIAISTKVMEYGVYLSSYRSCQSKTNSQLVDFKVGPPHQVYVPT